MSASGLRYLTSLNDLYDGKNGVKLTEIADKACVLKVSVYRAIERLEKDGFLAPFSEGYGYSTSFISVSALRQRMRYKLIAKSRQLNKRITNKKAGRNPCKIIMFG